MDRETKERLSASFGSVADAYDRGRPGFPDDAITWLVGQTHANVLELGAGTGKLTASLIRMGHAVHATEPDQGMLDVLRDRIPTARTSLAGAEEIPANDESVDVVVVAQAFHWFDHERALPEIARVLKPGGRLSLVWNHFDLRIPWVRRLGALLGGADVLGDATSAAKDFLAESAYFGELENARFEHWQLINRDSIRDLALSRSYIASLDDEAREERLAAIRAFYDDYGRGMDGMQLPYFAHCFRAVVDEENRPTSEPTALMDSETPVAPDQPATTETSKAANGPDDDLLLIDFR